MGRPRPHWKAPRGPSQNEPHHLHNLTLVAPQSILNDMPLDPVDRYVLSFSIQLRPYIRTSGGHFEYRYLMWLTANLLLQHSAPFVNISTDWQHYYIVLRFKCFKCFKCLIAFLLMPLTNLKDKTMQFITNMCLSYSVPYLLCKFHHSNISNDCKDHPVDR